MTKDESLKLALEALEKKAGSWGVGQEALNKAAITAIKEALAQPEQEPKHIVQSNGKYSPLLTHMMNKRTAPPKRPWVGLTDEDIAYAYTLEKKFAMQYVDAKLKEKNT